MEVCVEGRGDREGEESDLSRYGPKPSVWLWCRERIAGSRPRAQTCESAAPVV